MMEQNEWRFSRSREKSKQLLKGAIDIHVHAGPHLFSSPRSTHPVEAAIDARDAGMKAIAYMDVFNFTVGTAWTVNQVVENFTTYGGIILNTVYGGMNPRAVKTAVYYGGGARYVSFGAHSTYFQATREGRFDEKGVWHKLVDLYPEFVEEEVSRCIRIPEGKPTKELDEILTIIADNPQIYLLTGHVGNDEALRLCDYAKEYGIKKVLISNAVVENMSEAELELSIKKGALLEKCFACHTHTTPIPKTHYYVEEKYRAMDEGLQGTTKGVVGVANAIQKFGAENFVLSTDFGVYTLPKPVEGFREFIACMLDCGLSDQQIRMITSINPAKLLDIEVTDADRS
jgi:hypothetical protein